jgi:hypothetical protein
MAHHTHNTEPLFRTVRAAANDLGCSRQDHIAWVKPDRRLVREAGLSRGTSDFRPLVHTQVDPTALIANRCVAPTVRSGASKAATSG